MLGSFNILQLEVKNHRPELRKATCWLTGARTQPWKGTLLGATAFSFHCVAPCLASPAGPGLFSDPLPCACLLPELRQGRPANLQLLHSPQVACQSGPGVQNSGCAQDASWWGVEWRGGRVVQPGGQSADHCPETGRGDKQVFG